MRQFCAILGIQTQTGYLWRRQGRIRVVEIGKSIRVPKSELYSLLKHAPAFRAQCAREANDFMASHPDYFPTVGHEQAILNLLDDSSLPVTAANIAIAYDELKATGAIESRPTPTVTEEAPNA
jgi:hypothetical protein